MDGNIIVLYKCESVIGLRNCDFMLESVKYDLCFLLYVFVILVECLYLLLIIIFKWLYLFVVGIKYWFKNYWNDFLNV